MKHIYLFLTILFLAILAETTVAQVPFRQRTIQQIKLLLNEKALRTPAQRKMDSQLLQATREKRGRQMVSGVTLEPARVNTDAKGRIVVDISALVSDNLLSKIEAQGGKIIYPSAEYNTIRAEIDLSAAELIAAYPEVTFIQPAVRSRTVGGMNISIHKNSKESNTAFANSSFRDPSSSKNKKIRESHIREQIQQYLLTHSLDAPPFFSGTVNSEGDRTHRTDEVRNTFGYEGQGIKIGILSDSYNNRDGANADILNGELPGTGNPVGNTTPVTVIQENPGTSGSDEGRAMLQIVHDIAPKAQLFFATANISAANFATNIKTLYDIWHCDIIIDDVFYYDEAVFQDGIIAQAVNYVTNAGVLYFSSAGNSGSLAKNTSGCYEGDFNDTGSPAFTGGVKTGTIHNFGTVGTPVNGDIITAAGDMYILNWSDPIGRSNNDYDLFLVSASGTIKASSTNIQSGSQNPFEQITPPALVAGDRLVVFKAASAQIRAFTINTVRGVLTVATNGETHGHACAANAFGIAAAPASAAFGTGSPVGPYPGVFTASNKVENFSSDGPRRIFYSENGTPVTTGNFLFGTNGGVVRNKPDFTAADGVSTTFGTSSGLNLFFGTSAAAPHAGAIAALLKSAKPTLTIADIRTLFTNTSLDIEAAGYDINSGGGIIQAYQAMQAVNPAKLANIILGTVTTTEGSFSNGNGVVEPGELGSLVVQLTNPSLITASGVTAVLSTTTAGVTITQSSTAYGSIAASANASNSASPFLFAVNSSVNCGTIINFIITVSFGGGLSPQSFSFSVAAGKQPGASISASLGTPATGAGFISVTGTQTGRINRAAPSSVCGTQKGSPGIASGANTGARRFDAYTFTNSNTSSQCVTVTLTSAGGSNLYMVAYNNSGFVPTVPTSNFLADGGASSGIQTFGFTVPAGQSFTIVVHEVNPGGAVGTAYQLNVSLTLCNTISSCVPVNITTASLANGIVSNAYNQPIAASGGSNSGAYILTLTGGSLPSGLNLSNTGISGIPVISQIGTYSITVTASDPAGCTPISKNYTLRINAGSVTASAGTPQTASPGAAFATGLQVTVLDGKNNPVPNVSVVFNAPASGASGSFTGNQTTATVLTNSNGISTAPTFTANAILGTYNVTATAGGLTTNFALTNANCSISCPANITVNNDAGQCGAIVNFPAITSSCGAVTAVPASGSFFPIGNTTVTVTSGGGPSCSFVVTVKDNQSPVMNCPANIITSTDPNQCGAIVNFILPVATDNCTGTIVTASPASGSFFTKGNTTVTLTATDVSNNTSTCTFIVTVNDTQKPTINNCPANTTVNNDPGKCGAVVNYTAPTVSDNCPSATIVTTPASGSFFATGTTTVTSTATDAAGNITTCSFNITVKDNEAPVISSCPSNIIVNNDAGKCGAIVNFNLPTATDNCSGTIVTASPASGSFFAKGTTTVTCTATDASNNISTCTFTITVNDKEAPVITCPANIVTKSDAGKCTAVVTYAATATDNCAVSNISYSPASGSIFPIGTTTVTATAVDAAGNQSTCSFTVTVTDGQPATITNQPLSVTTCINQNTTLRITANNVAVYQWQINTGSGFSNISGANTDSLTVKNPTLSISGNQYRVVLTGVCSAVNSDAAVLTVVPVPTITLSVSPLSNLQPGNLTSISANTNPASGGSLVWTRNGITINSGSARILAGLTIDSIGTYKAVYTNICSVISSDLVIGALASDNLFVYPNPNKGRFQVRYYTPVNEPLHVRVTDFKGSVVYSKKVSTTGPYTEIDIDLTRTGTGLYLVEIIDKDNNQVGKKQIMIGH